MDIVIGCTQEPARETNDCAVPAVVTIVNSTADGAQAVRRGMVNFPLIKIWVSANRVGDKKESQHRKHDEPRRTRRRRIFCAGATLQFDSAPVGPNQNRDRAAEPR